MAHKGSNGKAKPPDVLSSLPSTRPRRLGAPRSKAAKRVAAPSTTTAAGRRPAPAKRARAEGPVAVSAGCPPLESPGRREPPPDPIGRPKGAELVTTAIQATGELARIGLTVGGRVLKRAVDRLSRP
jgi:hypothetical protein